MKKYLYGAAIQGIQKFIFQTNKLKDIVGASELVENICTEEFRNLLGNRWDENANVIGTAGNVKYVFDDRKSCADVVMKFPKLVMQKAPGITISQAVVEFDDTDDEPFSNTVNRLEDKLRAERNRPSLPLTTGLLGVMRSRQTGLPVTAFANDEPIDASTKAKRDASQTLIELSKTSFGKEGNKELKADRIAFDVSDMTGHNDWLAVIHADGNSLGQVVQAVGHDREKFREFSKKLDESTIRAANDAYNTINGSIKDDKKIPVRPVVLGGDDMTVIIRGNLAVDYAKTYLEKFEEHTKESLGSILTSEMVFADNADHLSACAGIAFIKSSYPFYYGYQLAEQLCDEAKKVAKAGLAETDGRKALSKSCLMFHKVQDSFVTSYSDIVRRELSTKAGISLKFGPYYIHESDLQASNIPESSMTIGQLLELCSMLNDAQLESIKTGIRRWLTLLHDNPGRQGQHLQRMKENYYNDKDKKKNNEKALKLIEALTKECRGSERAVCAFDALSLYTILNQKTKDDEDETDTL